MRVQKYKINKYDVEVFLINSKNAITTNYSVSSFASTSSVGAIKSDAFE